MPETVTYTRNWLSQHWDERTVEKFKKALEAGERPSDVDAGGWEKLKREWLFEALFDNKIGGFSAS